LKLLTLEFGTAMRSTLFTASVTLNASPIACPDRVSEVTQVEFITLAFPVKLFELALGPSAIEMLGGIDRGLEVELNVPAKSMTVPEAKIKVATLAVQVPASPRLSV
jgi:hypothetical protein